MAGVGRMRFALYALYSTIGGIVWSDGFLLLGHALGHIKFVREHKGDIDYLVVIAVLLTLIPVAIHYLQGRRQRTDG